jgi:hypothetical protein
MMKQERLPYLWDYEISEAQFTAMLEGQLELGRLDRRWAAVRLLEYAPYFEIIRLLGYKTLVEDWAQWRSQIRSESRKRGFDFLVKWLPKHHPELLQ